MQKLVLIVDDDPLYRDLARTVLENQNVSVVTAENGLEALKLLEAHTPHLIISDLRMPVMDGVEFYQKLTALRNHAPLPFVFLTGTGDQLLLDQVRRLSAPPILRKVDLVNSLRSLVEKL